jgi:hypothetical protein
MVGAAVGAEVGAHVLEALGAIVPVIIPIIIIFFEVRALVLMVGALELVLAHPFPFPDVPAIIIIPIFRWRLREASPRMRFA